MARVNRVTRTSVDPPRRAVLLDLDSLVLDAARRRQPGAPHEVAGVLRAGAVEQLRRLAGHRVDCAVLTTMPPGRSEEVLAAAGLTWRLRVVVARADLPRWMPSSLPVTRALHLLRWEGPVDRVAVVSDIPEAITMGRKARLRTVAITGGRSTAPALADAWPDVLAASLTDAVTAALDLTERRVRRHTDESGGPVAPEVRPQTAYGPESGRPRAHRAARVPTETTPGAQIPLGGIVEAW